MSVRQLSIFLENRPGRVSTIANILGKANRNILALSMADTKDFGLLRLIMDDTDAATQALSDNGVLCTVNEVTAIEMENVPGSMAHFLEVLIENGVNLEYMYALAEPKNSRPTMICRFDNPGKAIQSLTGAGIRILSNTDLGTK